jgi:tellurite resistance protein TerC
MDFSIIAIVIQLIFLEGILSIDNAAVLGAMVIPLSNTEPIPWPKALTKIGVVLDRVLGHQRVAALRVGLLGAYVGRGVMLIAAGEDESMGPLKVRTFWMTVLSVELMDLAFSLDNVVAAVSLSDKLWVVILGVFIGILVMRFAAGIFSYVIEKEPILKTAAYILVLNIGVELLLEDLGHVEIGDWLRFGISIATILLCLAYAHIPFLKIFRPLLIWFSQGFALVNGLISWIMAPIQGIFNLGVRLFKKQPAPAD